MKKKQNKIGVIVIIIIIAVALMFSNCAVGPKFQSPKVDIPPAYIYESVAIPGDSLVNISWWERFGDTRLDSLIQQALDSNRNLAIAASRIEQSRLQLRMTRADLAPSIGLGMKGEGTYTHNTKIVQEYSIEPNITWEVDLFGKLRRMSESARAEMLATEQTYHAVMLSLAAEVATTYFNLLQYDMSLRISYETYDIRRASQNIIDSMVYYGMSSAVDLQQAKGLTATAAAAIPQYERAKVQTEMALCALLGRNPYPMAVDGRQLLRVIKVPVMVPAGLPSSLLDRRPDIQQAYYQVASSTANIGVAVANRYPSLVLTGEGGLLSSTLKGLFRGNPFGWSASLSVSESLFAFGKNKRAVEIAKEINKQALLNYEQSVIIALGEVESTLSGVATYRSQVKHYWELLEATQTTQILTQELFHNGSSTYLNVLDAERELFSTQITFLKVISAQLAEYVSLYKALGGGW